MRAKQRNLTLFDSLSREQKEVCLQPGAEKFSFYCCGPTVYGPAHIGNFRTFVAQDIFRRVVELSGVPTFHVRNITDVDDKTIRDSQKQGASLVDFTTHWNSIFQADSEALSCLTPHSQPSAIEHIPQQIELIETLISKGFAYPSEDGSVYFKVEAFEDYGALSRLKDRELEVGKTANARSNADEYEKEGATDFVLWKARKPEDGENFWTSPWGEGRPGWHLECSAMIREVIGETVDLHGGGVDLMFPHHENEMAQSECACGQPLARHWFHVTHLLVDGGKMSKSLGNFYTLSDLEKLGHEAKEVRYVLASGHYRKPLNFLLSSLGDAKIALEKLRVFGEELAEKANAPLLSYEECLAQTEADLGLFQPAWNSLLNDLNVPEALGKVFTGIKEFRSTECDPEAAKMALIGFSYVAQALGLDLTPVKVEVPKEVEDLAAQRWEAKMNKDWAACDAFRDQIQALGFTVKDEKGAYTLIKN